jgi:nanoRNase/pAp phosphatase (c-di-AMP/oligoRNAs hydrolase)
MYFYLQPRIDIEQLAEIEHAQVPAAYFRSYVGFLQAARLYDGLLIAIVDRMSYPDLSAEIADLLLRLEGTQWVLCGGVYGDELVLSVRARHPSQGADEMAQEIVRGLGTAGGHDSMAGGHLPLQGRGREQLVDLIRRRALAFLNQPEGAAGLSLLPPSGEAGDDRQP